MSIDDPGWGGDSFGGGGGGDASGSGSGWGSPEGKPPAHRPSWLTVPYLAGGAAVLVVVIVVVVLVISRGGSGKPAVKAVVSRTPTTSVSKAPSTTPTPSPTGETIAAYDKLADAICQKDQPVIAAAGTDVQSQYTAAVDEFSDLEQLTSPVEQTEVQEDWIKQLSDALTDLTKDDETGYTNELMTADTTAGKLGMTSCNQGY